MERARAFNVMMVSLGVAAVCGVGAYAYWSYRSNEASVSDTFDLGSTPSLFPFVALLVVGGVALVVAVALGVMLAVQAKEPAEG